MTMPAALPNAGSRIHGGIIRLAATAPFDRFALIFTIALAPPVSVAAAERGWSLVVPLVGSLAVSAALTFAFARIRGRRMNGFCIPAAMVFALLMPPETPYWPAFLSLCFGVVVGEQVFGGRGFSFLHPAVAALAFLFFSFPGTGTSPHLSPAVATAAIVGAFLPLLAGMIAWRTLSGAVAGLAIGLAATGIDLQSIPLWAPAIVPAILFLVCDAPSGAATNGGRIAHGLLAGSLIAILGIAGGWAAPVRAAVFAALLASIFAPLIDRAVIAVHIRRRRRRLART